MNAQRWIALMLLLGIIVCVATANLWSAPFRQEEEEAGVAPTFDDFEADASEAEDADADAMGETIDILQPTPTIDPVIEELTGLMAESQVDVGNQPFIAYTGTFTTIDAAHRGQGSTDVYRLGLTEEYVLRLEDFSVSNGPDLRIILAEAEVPRTITDALLPSHIDLGLLKAVNGSQNYPIPTGVDFEKYRSVVIYSQSLNVVFTTAEIIAVRGGLPNN